MPAFIPGLELNRRFYHQAVRPILEQQFPGLPYAAARIGWGSDVLGYDTEMSTDHSWGPSMYLLLRDQDAGRSGEIHQELSAELPHLFCGFPVDAEPVPGEPGVTVMRLAGDGPVQHRVNPTSLRTFVRRHLDHELGEPLDVADWLTLSSQTLLEITAGAVYHDGIGDLTALRAQLAWYPHDVWLYLLACGWQRIGQEEHLMPRAGYVGDELGSSLIGSRLVRDVMSLCFLMERRYAPYPKWFGTAFRSLRCAENLRPVLEGAQGAPTWQEREAALGEAYEHLARMHNALGLTEQLPAIVSSFANRPFKVIHGEVFAQAIAARISDPRVRRIVQRGLIGSIDQWSDSTDMRGHISWRSRIRKLYVGEE